MKSPTACTNVLPPVTLARTLLLLPQVMVEPPAEVCWVSTSWLLLSKSTILSNVEEVGRNTGAADKAEAKAPSGLDRKTVRRG